MSLINDALNRAQAEAAGKEAADRGEIPALDGGGKVERERLVPASAKWAAVLAVVAIFALLTRRAGPVAKPEPERSAEAEITTQVEPTAPPPRTSAIAKDGSLPEELPPAAEDSATPSQPVPPAPTSVEAVARQSNADEIAATAAPSAEAPRSPIQVDRTTAPAEAEAPGQATLESPAAARADSRASEAPKRTVTATRPSTVWPADGTTQETWYFVGKVELAGGGEIRLDGIAWSELAPSAMLNGSLLTVGSEILGLRVVSIAPRTVTLAGQGQRLALQLGSGAN